MINTDKTMSIVTKHVQIPHPPKSLKTEGGLIESVVIFFSLQLLDTTYK